MLITKWVCEHPWADTITMFNSAYCEDRCLRQPWRVTIVGSYELVTQLSTYASYTVCRLLTAMCLNPDILPSESVPHLIHVASGFVDLYQLYIQGCIFGDCIPSVTVHQGVSLFWLYLSEWHTGWSAHHSAWLWFPCTLLMLYGVRCPVSSVLNLSIDLNSLTLAKSNWHVHKN